MIYLSIYVRLRRNDAIYVSYPELSFSVLTLAYSSVAHNLYLIRCISCVINTAHYWKE